MSTDMSEFGFESTIVKDMVAGGWIAGQSSHYDREYCLDLVQLEAFLAATQPELLESVNIGEDSPSRRKLLARIQGEVAKRGVLDVLRKGVSHEKFDIEFFYGAPSEGNEKAKSQYEANRFTVTRQLHYSLDETKRSLDLAIFINGLPVATFELKNAITKQTVADAVNQYKRDRNPKEKLFEFGRCMVHFAVDDAEAEMCTKLAGESSWFLPFNQGWDDGAGNPPNPDGLKTEYLWKDVLSPESLTDIIEHFAQIVEEKDDKTGKKKRTQIFPRFHQLSVVRELLSKTAQDGPGHRYLIQHSAGSGKSKSITWLSYRLAELQAEGTHVFDSVIVVTDRRILDRQLSKEIKQFSQVGSVVGHADRATKLKSLIEDGKKIIISTVQKFPYIVEEISGMDGKNFAILIDEAHSSQGGKTASAMSAALSSKGGDDEDMINQLIEDRQLSTNASYFAFTATPKNKTLEIFGEPFDDAGEKKFKPTHNYSMKQAIEEKFILDVLKSYTPVQSYYKLIKTIEFDPEFDKNRAQKKLRKYVEGNEHAIKMKAEIMVDHFHDEVIAKRLIGGQARAMIICNGIDRAIQYHHKVEAYLKERKSQYKSIVAFTGEHDYEGNRVSELSLNGFPGKDIADKINEDPYRFLVVADKFQTGYDEPLMHTMYVDKTLSGIKAVQTLSRLNRAHPKKHEVFVLDFLNDPQDIESAFSDYYRTTILSQETDPNKLHDLKAALDDADVYSDFEIDEFVEGYLNGVDRGHLDAILDRCAERYVRQLDEDEQVRFKGSAKTFVRTYDFLATILTFGNPGWEKLSIFLNFLIGKLPAPQEEDLSRGILQSIDMDSYRVEKQAMMSIILEDEDAEIGPVPTGGGGSKPEPELDRLSIILSGFNDQFGDIEWSDKDRVMRMITTDIPNRVAADSAYRNARLNNDKQNARLEHDRALGRVMTELLKDDTDLFKHFSDNASFKKWLSESVFETTYSDVS